jgi:hypothetical protein
MVDQREPSLAPIHGESLERVKGIEPSSSAWKAACFVNQINEYLHFFRAENCLFAPKVDTLLKGPAFGNARCNDRRFPDGACLLRDVAPDFHPAPIGD